MSGIKSAGWWTDLIEDLKEDLMVATTMRDQRQETVSGPDGDEPGWVRFERELMVELMNRHLAEAGLPPTDEAAALVVERGAMGHIDYVAKYALGCAEIVVGQRSAETGQPLRLGSHIA